MTALCLLVLASALPASGEPSDPSLLPPAVLFHFGSRKVLEEDARARGIPKEAWDKYVMGEGASHWSLPPYRRGFYGCSQSSWCEIFAAGEEPWFIAFRVKAECRAAQALVVPQRLSRDPRFAAWLERPGAPALKPFDRFCPPGSLNVGIETDYEGPCEKAVARFLNEERLPAVLDEALPSSDEPEKSLMFPDSWYFRDRSCIEDVEGTPEQMLSLLADPSYWDDPQRRSVDVGLPVPRSAATTCLILAQALAGAPRAGAGTLTAISAGAERADRLGFFGRLPGGRSLSSAAASMISSYGRGGDAASFERACR